MIGSEAGRDLTSARGDDATRVTSMSSHILDRYASGNIRLTRDFMWAPWDSNPQPAD
jgi:hypothetical protein